MNNIVKSFLLFILLIFFQITIFNQIHIVQTMNISIYILFLLWLPYKTPRWLLLLVGFAIGYIIDAFSNTGGIHAAASVLIAYFRPYFINLITNKYEIEYAKYPSINTIGLRAYIYYLLFFIFIHNFSVFYLELFHLKNFFYHLLLISLNTITTFIICLIIELLFRKSKSLS